MKVKTVKRNLWLIVSALIMIGAVNHPATASLNTKSASVKGLTVEEISKFLEIPSSGKPIFYQNLVKWLDEGTASISGGAPISDMGLELQDAFNKIISSTKDLPTLPGSNDENLKALIKAIKNYALKIENLKKEEENKKREEEFKIKFNVGEENIISEKRPPVEIPQVEENQEGVVKLVEFTRELFTQGAYEDEMTSTVFDTTIEPLLKNIPPQAAVLLLKTFIGQKTTSDSSEVLKLRAENLKLKRILEKQQGGGSEIASKLGLTLLDIPLTDLFIHDEYLQKPELGEQNKVGEYLQQLIETFKAFNIIAGKKFKVMEMNFKFIQPLEKIEEVYEDYKKTSNIESVSSLYSDLEQLINACANVINTLKLNQLQNVQQEIDGLYEKMVLLNAKLKIEQPKIARASFIEQYIQLQIALRKTYEQVSTGGKVYTYDNTPVDFQTLIEKFQELADLMPDPNTIQSPQIKEIFFKVKMELYSGTPSTFKNMLRQMTTFGSYQDVLQRQIFVGKGSDKKFDELISQLSKLENAFASCQLPQILAVNEIMWKKVSLNQLEKLNTVDLSNFPTIAKFRDDKYQIYKLDILDFLNDNTYKIFIAEVLKVQNNDLFKYLCNFIKVLKMYKSLVSINSMFKEMHTQKPEGAKVYLQLGGSEDTTPQSNTNVLPPPPNDLNIPPPPPNNMNAPPLQNQNK